MPADFNFHPAVTHLATNRIHGLLGDWPIFGLIGETVLIRDLM